MINAVKLKGDYICNNCLKVWVVYTTKLRFLVEESFLEIFTPRSAYLSLSSCSGLNG